MSRYLNRWLITTGLLASCSFLMQTAAYASQSAGRNDHGGYTVGSNGNRTGVVGAGGSTSGSPGTGGNGIDPGAGPPPGWVPYQIPQLVTPRSYCLITIYAPPNTNWPGYNPVSGMTQVPCSGAPAPQPIPGSTIATQWVSQATLPAPTLSVNPGYAVTGLTAYLQIEPNSPYTTIFSPPGPVPNAIHITCTTSSYDVDWGDGGPITHTTSTGGPYPNGDVTHVYQTASARDDLTVTSHWGCNWTDNFGAAGTIPDLHSTGRLPLEVREIQSVNDG